MRKITQDAFKAFVDGKPFRRTGNGHTVVDVVPSPYSEIGPSRRYLYLHGNLIAEAQPDGNQHEVHVTTAGWNTVTTRERLKPFAYVSTAKGDLFLDGKAWDGSRTLVGHIREGVFVPLRDDVRDLAHSLAADYYQANDKKDRPEAAKAFKLSDEEEARSLALKLPPDEVEREARAIMTEWIKEDEEAAA